MLPDLESLRCFDAAARHLNFRAASAAVALSPAAFGDRIKRLEDQLEIELFVRTTRRIELTAAGQRLVPHVRQLLADAEACSTVVRADDRPLPFALSLGTRFELGLSWITPALKELTAHQPERTLHLVFGDSPDLIGRVRHGALDCVVTSARLTFGDLAYTLLHDEDYVFVASSKLRRLTSAEQAAEHTLLDVAADLPLFRYLLDADRGRRVWGFARTEYLGTIGAIRQRLLQGAGVAVLPRYFVEQDLRARRLVRLVPSLELKRDAFRLVWRAGHPRTRELRALAGELAAIPLR